MPPTPKEEGLAELAERKANQPTPIDNASLPAGAPMYYYCKLCGHLADTKPESWFRSLPRKLCTPCQHLKDMGWLDD